jgi:hypothetical protein
MWMWTSYWEGLHSAFPRSRKDSRVANFGTLGVGTLVTVASTCLDLWWCYQTWLCFDAAGEWMVCFYHKWAPSTSCLSVSVHEFSRRQCAWLMLYYKYRWKRHFAVKLYFALIQQVTECPVSSKLIRSWDCFKGCNIKHQFFLCWLCCRMALPLGKHYTLLCVRQLWLPVWD